MKCRTVLRPGEGCDVHPSASTLDLADSAQRARAVEAVWGRKRIGAAEVAGAGAVGVAGGALKGCEAGGCVMKVGGLSAEGLVVVCAIVLVALLYYGIQQYRERPRPHGSDWEPQRGQRVLRGNVRDAVTTNAPLSGAACAAWGVIITHGRAKGGRYMLRDGATEGMTIELGDGRLMTIPAGRVRVAGAGRKATMHPEYLGNIDPQHSACDERPVIPIDEAREVRLAVGDPIEIIAGLEERFDPNAPAGYRDAPKTMLVLAGTPTLVRLES